MNLWDQILARIETKMNRHAFYTWFRTDLVRDGRPRIGDRAGARLVVSGLADEALRGRDQRGYG
jgi:hypothetical protein